MENEIFMDSSSNFMDTIVAIFPARLWAPLVNATMLQVIVIALFIGVDILPAARKAA